MRIDALSVSFGSFFLQNVFWNRRYNFLFRGKWRSVQSDHFFFLTEVFFFSTQKMNLLVLSCQGSIQLSPIAASPGGFFIKHTGTRVAVKWRHSLQRALKFEVILWMKGWKRRCYLFQGSLSLSVNSTKGCHVVKHSCTPAARTSFQSWWVGLIFVWASDWHFAGRWL